MIHILIGTRAQLIKMAPVMHELKERGIDYNFIFMPQHSKTIYEMIDNFGLKRPDYVIGKEDGDIVSTGAMVKWSISVILRGLKERKKIFQGDKDGIVLIHGDAPPLFLGALLAKAQGLKVGQVEAGLRSFNLMKPFPEELTRVITAKLGWINTFYSQDDSSYENTLEFKKKSIHTKGNTMYDALQLAKVNNQNRNPKEVVPELPEKFALVTIHRYETLTNKERMDFVVDKLEEIAKKMPLVIIMHPPTYKVLKDEGYYDRLDKNKDILLVDRLSFFDFNLLFINCQFIISDGGSNQEESAYLGIPCLLFRTETERTEGIDSNAILSMFEDNLIDDFVDNYTKYRKVLEMKGSSPTEIIVEDLLNYVN